MKKSDGELLAKFKVESVQSLDERRSSSGIAPSLFPGSLTTLQKIDEGSENQEYLVTHCSHVINTQAYRSGRGGGGEQVYSGHYEMTPSSRQFRAPLVTHKPTIPARNRRSSSASRARRSTSTNSDASLCSSTGIVRRSRRGGFVSRSSGRDRSAGPCFCRVSATR